MLNISNIQHFSIGDGMGIRTTVFFKGCNLCCPWCHNPENLNSKPVVMKYKNFEKTEVMGKMVLAEEILPELLEDIDFYSQSRGGVTFSGGEVMLQAKEAAELATLLKANGISVLIDTAGCVPYRQFEILNNVVDGYLFDFKTADKQKYSEIGGNLQLVTENIRKLKKDGVNVFIRIPLIPGFNTDYESVCDICRNLKNIGIEEVELLPFHRLATAKYEALGVEYVYKNVMPLTKNELYTIKKIYEKNFRVKIEK